MLEKLRAMYSFCAHPQCRHRFLSRYFGQEYTETNCAACDYCLGEVEMVEEPLVLSQKIISCVARVKERFGADHVAAILKGANDEAITKWGHQQLSTFGLLTEMPKTTIRYMTEQLVGQGFLKREGEYSTLTITAEGRRVLKGEITPALAKPLIAQKKKESTRRQKAQRMRSLEGVDETLFDLLRKKRAELAQEKGVPAYIIFSDKSLQDMATKKPVTLDDFTSIYGVGETKLRQYAAIFTALIKDYMMQKS
jgi:ATP-dependent DNA helicase RecQ